ncbi:GNAT family N-acetyltransferase [Streptomyces nitrosporeus]|uniref:GNAT family N-acetyltransferase n=1 Tax=Streptomyces nitrosporeus TaxID=28894 RepID=A0A5J6FFW0_9ACTN|nr:GNAT family N-acetyltransferase [Streptomyces nitrosporeus]QEU75429.1 GNAT family N-acetyltransferase [Streptomyces nitrosporeus]GGZ02133.1 N-acetyltransferase [Streptomyces nitrosporeus]
MTTTLRPAGPAEEGADGARTRTYEVCDNGRPVGAVEIGTDPRFGSSAAVLRSLRIDEGDRRRGRGTIAALAAEEVLRGWGCTRISLVVPEGNEAATAFATALGYTPRSRNMAKSLQAPAPALPDGVTERPMTEQEYAAWASTSVEEYARSWIERDVPEDQARLKAERDHATGLPDGLATEGMHFHVLVRGDDVLGHVWVARHSAAPHDAPIGYVFDVEVREEVRGHGYGRALMHLAEDLTLRAGLGRLGLHVFETNTPALRLYESLGYTTTQYNLAKAL